MQIEFLLESSRVIKSIDFQLGTYKKRGNKWLDYDKEEVILLFCVLPDEYYKIRRSDRNNRPIFYNTITKSFSKMFTNDSKLVIINNGQIVLMPDFELRLIPEINDSIIVVNSKGINDGTVYPKRVTNINYHSIT